MLLVDLPGTAPGSGIRFSLLHTTIVQHTSFRVNRFIQAVTCPFLLSAQSNVLNYSNYAAVAQFVHFLDSELWLLLSDTELLELPELLEQPDAFIPSIRTVSAAPFS